MNNLFRSLLLAAIFSAGAAGVTSAQTQPTETKEAAYTRTITERANKIVATLGELDPKKSTQVRETIVDQYRALNEVHEARKAKLKELKAKPQDEGTAAEIKKVEGEAKTALDKLHKKYIAKLSRNLNAGQVDQVKDGMTYGVLPITYRGYQEMLPNLTEPQKTQILTWLTEARELAMDASTSEEKHAWFGKYKGKINNYLSAAGIDMKQAGKDWEARRREAGNSDK